MKEKKETLKKDSKNLKETKATVLGSPVENAENKEVLNVSDTNKQSAKKKLKIKPKRLRTPQNKAVRINASIKDGLTDKQAEQRYVDGLSNLVNEKYSKSIFSIIFSNTFTFFNLLCVLVLIAYLTVKPGIGNYTFILPFTINLVIAIIQEIRAKVSVEKLAILQAPNTSVVRNGKEQEIPSSEVVLDDIFKIVTGNQIPVDATVIDGFVEVNESLLTGESIAVKKQAGSTIMAGSYVTSGSCYARADKVGGECYVQKLTSKAKKFKKPHSELMNTLNWIIKIVGILIIPIAIGIGLVNYKNVLIENEELALIGEKLLDVPLTVVTRTCSVILGMIPAGLMLLTTIALSLGVIRLFKSNTLVQDMYSLEMLARVDVLCLDKTGTITDGKMKIEEEILLAERHKYPLNDIIGNMENILDDHNQTATALRAHYLPTNDFTAIKTLPFSSQRKFSAVTFLNVGTYAIGAPEFILSEIPQDIKLIIDRYTIAGCRVLLLAHSTASITSKEKLPSTMKPIALIVLTDNIRPEAIETIKWFKENDVQVKVISGDNPITVSEIAKRAGIENASNWISLEGLSNKEIASVANKYTVFGRVTPDQKAVLIKALKRVGHTVAMTGDGVNDILAMRESDCSVTVASGSDSVKNIAHIVLADNNFNSMPKVVQEGRRVINNIKTSSSLFLMKTLFITLLALISVVLDNPFPFNSVMLTMLEIFVIGFASLLLSLQPNEKRVEGDFLASIFSSAIPGAIIMLLNVFVIRFFNEFGIFTSSLTSTTMQVVAFTIGGAIFLYKICKPYNALRTILIMVVAFAVVFWMLALLDTTNLIGFNYFELENVFTKEHWENGLLMVTITLADSYILDMLFKLNKKTFSGLTKK
ncbi:MAG: HAD-IC family P-type ATPase [Clostridia bacterium]|nr:HAD-IC family P-type ATPase [Clostridia bacterium]